MQRVDILKHASALALMLTACSDDPRGQAGTDDSVTTSAARSTDTGGGGSTTATSDASDSGTTEVDADTDSSGAAPPPPPDSSGPRYLFVSEPGLLQPLSFERVVEALLTSATVTIQSPSEVYRDWWDALNNTANAANSDVVHCDEPNEDSALNDFPVACPAAEGALAHLEPFGAMPLYRPVGAVNRFDLAPADFANCGEYRLIYVGPNGVHFVSVEAVLPNPNPATGLAGCRPVLEFWQALGDLELPDKDVTSELERLFFTGLSGFPPVIHIDHLNGTPGSGTIRTNTETGGDPADVDIPIEWTLLQFAATRDCSQPDCTIQIKRQPLANTPHETLFESDSATALELQDAFVQQLGSFEGDHFDELDFQPPASTLAGESVASDPPRVGFDIRVAANASLTARLTTRRAELGIALTQAELATRLEVNTCAGCHRMSSERNLGGGLEVPRSLGFTHIDAGGNLSSALLDVLLPRRQTIFEQALAQ